MTDLFKVHEIGRDIWEIVDIADCHCYLVRGSRRAVLVDSCLGVGNLRACVQELAGGLPVTVLLTHRHYDHVAGSYLFGDVHLPEGEGAHPEIAEEQNQLRLKIFDEECRIDNGTLRAMRDGGRPDFQKVAEGDIFNLGGVTIEAVSLPGHTDHSMGYLVRERRLLLSGDAVTPIMCLFFQESLSIAAWKNTLRKMERLDFDAFRTGHHSHAFSKEDIASFELLADYAFGATDWMEWMHSFLPGCTGSLYVSPGSTITDVDSPHFRALIGPYRPRPKKHRLHRRHGADQEDE